MKAKAQTLTVTLTLALLTACGGGGDSNPSVDNNQGNNNRNINPTQPVNKNYVMNFTDGFTDEQRAVLRRLDFQRNGKKFITVESNRISVEAGDIPARFAEFPMTLIITTTDGQQLPLELKSRSYKGNYAGAISAYPSKTQQLSDWKGGSFDIPYIDPTRELPKSGTVFYSGRAFNYDAGNDASLSYSINFDNRIGKGEISASRNLNRIILRESPIINRMSYFGKDVSGVFHGTAYIEGNNYWGRDETFYHLGIAGPNAEEIVGVVGYPSRQNDDIPVERLFFHGSRGGNAQ